MQSALINTRADLDALEGTPEHDAFMQLLAGSMKRKENHAVYPDGYGKPGYEGPNIEAEWVEVEDLSTIKRFGFKKLDFQSATSSAA